MHRTPAFAQLPPDLARPHLAGVLGDGQSALAALLRHDGAEVSGCDIGGRRGEEKQGPLRSHLQQLGINVVTGHATAHLVPGTTALIVSTAVPPAHPELCHARSRGVPVLRRDEALGRYARLFRQVAAVAGGAGKTSTSAILATILVAAARQPAVYLGARSANLGGNNYLPGSRDLLIAEADEYMDAFLSLPRSIGILGPVMDYDHRDYFRTERDVSDAFTAFAAGLELAIADGDSPAALRAARAARRVISVGCSPGSDWRIADVDPQRGSWRLADPRSGTALTLSTAHRGPALWMNASRAAVAALELGVPAAAVEHGIRAYQGVSRRMELRHSAPGVLMLDDYAHNPAQIQALALALRGYYPQRRIIAVFEPRQHRRTALYCDQFGQALASFGACLLLPISPGLGDQEYGHLASLGAVRDAITRHGGPPARICDSYDHAAAVLAGVVRYGDVVVSVGTGSPYLALDTLASMIELAS